MLIMSLGVREHIQILFLYCSAIILRINANKYTQKCYQIGLNLLKRVKIGIFSQNILLIIWNIRKLILSLRYKNKKNNKQITITIMEKTYPTIKGKDLEWHTDPNDLPPYSIREHIIVAYAYRKTPSTESYADRVCFDTGDLYIGDKEHTYQIAWAVFDTDIPKDVLNKIISDRKKYQEDHADEIKAKRIAELEAELAELKK